MNNLSNKRGWPFYLQLAFLNAVFGLVIVLAWPALCASGSGLVIFTLLFIPVQLLIRWVAGRMSVGRKYSLLDVFPYDFLTSYGFALIVTMIMLYVSGLL